MRKSKATEALRVAQELAVIRTALRKRGYHMRKRPKQAAWSIYNTDNYFCLLTYQPAPVGSWVLYPQNDDRDRQSIETIIQRTLAKRSANIPKPIS